MLDAATANKWSVMNDSVQARAKKEIDAVERAIQNAALKGLYFIERDWPGTAVYDIVEKELIGAGYTVREIRYVGQSAYRVNWECVMPEGVVK